MSFETFDFSLERIKERVASCKSADEKLEYLYYIRKELKRVIRCFESDRFVKSRITADDCRERDEFYQNEYSHLSNVYGTDDKRTYDAIDNHSVEKKEELKDCLLSIEDEIEFVSKFANTELNRNLDKLDKSKTGLIIEGEKERKKTSDESPEQDTLIEKFQRECENRKLQKGKTIPREILFEIAKAIGKKVNKIEDFKSGEKNYQIMRQYASLLKYKRKKPDQR